MPRLENGTSTPTKDFVVQVQVDRADLAPYLPCAIEVLMNNVTVGEYTLLAMPIAGIGGAKVPLPVAANGTDPSKGTSEDYHLLEGGHQERLG